MVKFFDCLSDELRDWALQQQVFFIASAPTNGRHINVSPKGLPASTLTVFDPNHAAYIDATGSGAETISHLYENGRATIMFCSFGKTPRIMRWFCTGRVVEYDQPEFESLLARMDKAKVEGARAVIVLEMFKVQTSCGYAVPLLADLPDSEVQNSDVRSRLEDRKTLGHWMSQQVEKGVMDAYRAKNNARSLDDLGGLNAARRLKGENIPLTNLLIRLKRCLQQWDAMLLGALLTMIAFMFLPSLRHRYAIIAS